MEIELLNEEDRSLNIKIIGEGHTLCNVLRKTLYEDKQVLAASYVIEHPILESPKFYVKTDKGKSPRQALIDASERIIEGCRSLSEQLEKAIKK
jgi:DNA-directed RNA polymerase subunit L